MKELGLSSVQNTSNPPIYDMELGNTGLASYIFSACYYPAVRQLFCGKEVELSQRDVYSRREPHGSGWTIM